VKAGALDLAQRAGRDRGASQLGEGVGERPPDLPLDVRLKRLERSRRHAVLELRQDLDVRVREDVRARADELTDLDRQPLETDREVVETARARPVLSLEGRARVRAEAAAELDELVARVDASDEQTLETEASGAAGDHDGGNPRD